MPLRVFERLARSPTYVLVQQIDHIVDNAHHPGVSVVEIADKHIPHFVEQNIAEMVRIVLGEFPPLFIAVARQDVVPVVEEG